MNRKRIVRYISILFLSLLLSSTWIYSSEEAPLLEVTFLDIGQGDSIFIHTPAGKSILIDGGATESGFHKFDAGKRVIIPFLRKKKIYDLYQIIATHPDLDHIGGLIAVLKRKLITIKEVLDPGVQHTTVFYKQFLEAILAKKETKYSQPRSGDILDWGEGVTAEVLSPPYLFTDSNDCSIVVKLTYGNISFLFTGDASITAEDIMIKKWKYKLKSTILKAGHHGSKHSSGDRFLKYVRPEIATLSCGVGNPYGHPHPEVMKRLKRVGAKIYRNDTQGNITVKTDGKKYWVTTEK